MQYFVWSDDAAANLVLQRLLQAADRGVQVRVLVDDLYLLSDSSLRGPDSGLAAVAQHPNVQLRVYNPGKYRSGTVGIAGNFMGSFKEFNRRMHNKLFIADGQLAILGGRNIANEYFGLKEEYNFLDLDILVAGEVVPSMIEAFDIYWNAEAVFPAEALAEPIPDDAWQALRDDAWWCLVETPNRLWYHDGHTSWLPFLNWLPDELALPYLSRSPKPALRELSQLDPEEHRVTLRRRGRALSFHEFELYMDELENIEVVSDLAQFRRRHPALALRWQLSDARRYENLLARRAPDLHRGFLQPNLDLLLRKRRR